MTSCQQAKRSYGLESGGVAAWNRGSRQPGTPSLEPASRQPPSPPLCPRPRARIHGGLRKIFSGFLWSFFKGETR